MISGVYSSIFIATPLLAYLKSRHGTKDTPSARMVGDDLRAAVMGAGVTGRVGEDNVPRATNRTTNRSTTTASSGATASPNQADRLLTHPPRPRKKKRR
jgi:preprotein translocase subunit SecF